MIILNSKYTQIASPVTVRRFALSLTDRRVLWIALSLLLAIRLLAVFWLPFTDTTEARYAEIARKMLETGDWITPQFDYGVPFWGKPPLHTWLSALGMKLFGVGAFGARVFILTTALAVLALIYSWVRQHRGTDQALVAAVVLSSGVLFFGASAFVMTDMVMVLGTTLSMVSFYNFITGTPARVLWARLFFVGVAIGLLAKGPTALVITMIPIVPWLIFQGRWRNLGGLPWRSGLLITAVLVLPWYIAAELKTPGFLRYFIIGEHFERFVISGWQGDLYGSGHARAKGLIWIYWLATFMPWTLFAVALLPRLQRVLGGADRGWHAYLALWTIAPLLLFTPAANILAAYVLPGLPAAAILLVSLWAQLWGAPGKWARTAVLCAIGVVGVGGLTLTVLSYAAPATVGLKSERELIAAAQNIDPDIQFTYWGKRTYSAEFYTHGAVTFTDDTAMLSALSLNNVRDAVAIHDSVAPPQILQTQFTRIGTFGRRVLFIENPIRRSEP